MHSWAQQKHGGSRCSLHVALIQFLLRRDDGYGVAADGGIAIGVVGQDIDLIRSDGAVPVPEHVGERGRVGLPAFQIEAVVQAGSLRDAGLGGDCVALAVKGEHALLRTHRQQLAEGLLRAIDQQEGAERGVTDDHAVFGQLAGDELDRRGERTDGHECQVAEGTYQELFSVGDI